MTTWIKNGPEVSDFEKFYGTNVFDIGVFDECRFDGLLTDDWSKIEGEDSLFTAVPFCSTAWGKLVVRESLFSVLPTAVTTWAKESAKISLFSSKVSAATSWVKDPKTEDMFSTIPAASSSWIKKNTASADWE